MFSQKTHLKKIGTALLAGTAALCLLLMMTVSVFANTVHVYDKAGVLNASQIQSDAANLSYPIDIYTVASFNGDRTAFQQRTASYTANNSNLIVMAIDTGAGQHFLDIQAGSRVPLSNGGAQNAINAFKNNYGSGDYNAATAAALSSLQNSLSAASGSGSNGSAPPVPAQGGFFGGIGFSTLCCIGLLILAGIAVFAFVRRRSRPAGGFGWFNQRRANIPPQDPYYNQPYNQGYPPNYGPGYPGYNQGGGINPLVAGGLGAAAGGLVGYELGKEVGERDQGQQDQGNQGGDYGNNNGGNFGGGASGDFGGGGGGGDFGGGGGGGDLGGGGSGSF